LVYKLVYREGERREGGWNRKPPSFLEATEDIKPLFKALYFMTWSLA